MKHIIPFVFFVTLLISCAQEEQTSIKSKVPIAFSIESKSDPFARMTHDHNMLIDPATGKIPAGIRDKELAFFRASTVSVNKNLTADWESRGPYNVGGRTRGFAIDRSNENIMLAGAASGGVWKSVDAGQNWYKVTTGGSNTSVTSLIQDPRAGHELEWYFTTGELFGASHSGTGAFYLGNGVYKSADGGETWTGIASTQNSTPQSFDSILEGLWRIAIDPSNLDSTEMYLASYGSIWRSWNGGDTWSQVIDSSEPSGSSYFTDVTVTNEGVVYATLSYESEIVSFGLGPNGGVYRSPDGVTWTDIRPEDYPERFSRTVIAVDPSDEDRVYFLAANVDSLSGFQGEFFNGGVQYSALWRYDYLSGNGSGANGEWANLTENLPADTGIFDDFYPQSGYDLTIAVSPANPQLIVIGGTNLYRNTDGFTSVEANTFIGGYAEHSSFPDFEIYDGHHPDMHGLVFLPSNPQVMYNVNDGGIYRTDDISADLITWNSLNQGYLTTQVYGLGVDIDEPTDRVVAGLQDNGNQFVNSDDPTADWTLPLNGDGAYTFFARNEDFALLSIQQGRVFKCNLSDEGELLGFERIDPGLERDGHDFIHPYCLSPNDDGTMYFPYQNKLYVHRGIDTVSVGADYEANLDGWEVFEDSLSVANLRITSISAAEDGTDRLYLGTSNEKVYRIDDATDLSAPWIDVTLSAMPAAHLDCIAIDPFDSGKAMVVYTNYGIYSLYYTDDAGENWEKSAGNLEQFSSGGGNGPSCRWATIHRWHPDSVVYYVGTSIGLFSTSELMGVDTEWQIESPDQIGNTVVSHVVSREIDKKVFAGTHGGGVYEAEVQDLSLPSGVNQEQRSFDLAIHPNPSIDYITVSSIVDGQGIMNYTVLDMMGKIVYRTKVRSGVKLVIDTREYAEGMYHVLAGIDGRAAIRSFVKTR
jgi:photosystem II stability/assembly factor-like uncharacterized protein